MKGDFVLRYHKSNGEEVIMYTNEERESAMQVSLTSLARSLGYTPIKQGSLWTLKEMDSLKIHNDKSWYRWSGRGNRTGGSQIDFLMEFGGVIYNAFFNYTLENVITRNRSPILE